MHRQCVQVCFVVATLGVLGGSNQALAAPLTFNYTATVFSSDLPGLADGTVMSGSFTYDTVGVDAGPGPSFGHYVADASLAFSVNTGAYAFDGSTFVVAERRVLNDFAAGEYLDTFQLDARTPALTTGTTGYTLSLAQLILVNFEPTAPVPPLDSDAIPTTLSLSDWDPMLATGGGTRMVFQVRDSNLQTYATIGALTSLTVGTSVAEPSTVLLLGTGIVMAGTRRFSRRRRADARPT